MTCRILQSTQHNGPSLCSHRSVLTRTTREKHDRNPAPNLWFVIPGNELCFLDHLGHLFVDFVSARKVVFELL